MWLLREKHHEGTDTRITATSKGLGAPTFKEQLKRESWAEGTDLPTLSVNQWILEVRLFYLFVAPAGGDLELAKGPHPTAASPILNPATTPSHAHLAQAGLPQAIQASLDLFPPCLPAHQPFM